MSIAKAESPTFTELAAFAYLAGPVAIFFLTFITPWVGIPAALLIGVAFVTLALKARRETPAPPWWALGFSTLVVCAWMALAGYGAVLPTNSDWIKHYAIMNALAHNPWPVVIEGEVLRYALGWYMVPALAMKWFGGEPNLYLSAWTLIGMLLFMRLALSLFASRTYMVMLPIVFVLFSGADVFGTWLTGYQFGPVGHIEWWSGWAEYPSNTTSIFWTPQHALPAWLSIALLMRQRDNPTMVPSLGIVFFATCFWSPFAAIGLLPFSAVLVHRYGIRPILSGKTLAALALVGLPLANYLLAGSGGMPHSLAMDAECKKVAALCFSASGYLTFAAVEFVLIAALLFAARSEHRGALIAASLSLLVYPLIHFGVANDLTMRASIAPLAVLAILSANALAKRGSLAAVPLTVLLTLGAFTATSEAYRAFISDVWPSQKANFAGVTQGDQNVMRQYFASGITLIKAR